MFKIIILTVIVVVMGVISIVSAFIQKPEYSNDGDVCI